MPTCDNKAKPTSLGNLSAAELDHHASEAAKVKRTKEQAYFNSYDFDAIEVLPYEEDDDDDVVKVVRSQSAAQHQHHHHHGSHAGHHPNYTMGGCKTCHHSSPQSASVSPGSGKIVTALPTVSHSHSLNSRPHHHQQQPQLKKNISASSHSSSNNSSLSSFSHPAITVANSKRTYLKRIGAFFTSHSMGKRSSMDSLTDIEKQIPQASSSASSSQLSSKLGKVYDGSGNREHVIDETVNSNFLLPRAMLKYQSIGFGNSMPLSVISNLGGSSTSLKSNSISAQLNQVSNNSGSIIITKSQLNPLESSISAAADGGSISNYGNLKKPPNLGSAAENSGFISSSSISQSTLSALASSSSLAKSSLAISSLSAESSIIGETSANVHVSGGAAALAIAGAPVGSKPITNPNVVSSITSDLQQSYNEKLALSSSSSSSASASATAAAITVVGGGGSGGTSSSVSSIKTMKIGGSGNAAITSHSSTGRGARERTSSHSHYSTDKSGSSGYYSSNVCSTYSVEDHIYCEPVIDILEVSKSATLKSSKLGLPNGTAPRKIMIVHNSDDDDEDHHHHHLHQHVHDRQHMKQNLRILEDSIENLDRHLKNYPKITAQDRIASFVQSNGLTLPANVFQMHDVLKNRYGNLPTIMEGGGGTADGPASLQKSWQEEIADDSLLDIDLDSFLLVSEGKSNTGIDNPTFDKAVVLHDEDMENNYKCAKYINSCPEDAYRLESEVGSSLDHFLKKYEDQIHFQNTRELLEDVRDKIRLLSSERNATRSTAKGGVNKQLPEELDAMIKALKSELETYLERMNQHSEMEIRQLCTGLVKNQNIVKMKKAFERRKSNSSDPEYDFAYEAVRDAGTLVTVQHTRQQIETTSIRCMSDPNFKMKRKSLSEIFPSTDVECYVGTGGDDSGCAIATANASVTDQAGTVLNDGAPMPRTQLQKNLSFHKPILNKLGGEAAGEAAGDGDKDSILDWHRKKPSIWEMYYGTNRKNQTLLGKRGVIVNGNQAILSYPSSRPESDFTLDLPRAEQLRIKMEKEKKFRRRCRYLTTFLSLVFFLLTVMVVSLVLTRGKRMFGSMI